MNKAEAQKYFAEKDRQYAENVKTGVWPSDTCEKCIARGHCCEDFTHHLYSCCTHCGNDERNVRVHRYRGH